MSEQESQVLANRKIKQALVLWGVYLAVTFLVNATLPFIFGVDVGKWTYSPAKDVLVNVIIYWGVFLLAPMILVKGWDVVRQPAFIGPLLVAAIALSLRTFFRPVSILAILIIIFLHWRYNLAEVGIRSSGWRGDLVAIGLVGLVYIEQVSG
jgi:hypothetical protein